MNAKQFEVRRFIPEVSAELAEMLSRPANAHTVVEVWEEIQVYPDPLGCLQQRGEIKQKRLVSSRREDFRPLAGVVNTLIVG